MLHKPNETNTKHHRLVPVTGNACMLNLTFDHLQDARLPNASSPFTASPNTSSKDPTLALFTSDLCPPMFGYSCGKSLHTTTFSQASKHKMNIRIYAHRPSFVRRLQMLSSVRCDECRCKLQVLSSVRCEECDYAMSANLQLGRYCHCPSNPGDSYSWTSLVDQCSPRSHDTCEWRPCTHWCLAAQNIKSKPFSCKLVCFSLLEVEESSKRAPLNKSWRANFSKKVQCSDH